MRSYFVASLALLVACNLGEGAAPGGGGGGGGGGEGIDAPSGGGGGGGGLDASPEGSGSGSDVGSGSGSGSGSAAVTGGTCINRSANIQPAHQHNGGAGTHAGQDCMQAGCHAQGGGGPQFQFAGTLYKTGGTVADTGGATIEIVANGKTTVDPNSPITDNAGNFYVYAGSITGAFPAKVWATACPTVTPMNTAVANGQGGCNSCHKAGQQGPITLQ